MQAGNRQLYNKGTDRDDIRALYKQNHITTWPVTEHLWLGSKPPTLPTTSTLSNTPNR